MKKTIIMMIGLLTSTSFYSCDGLSPECVADVAVTTLDAPAAVISGDVIEVVCVIKNVISTINECTNSGPCTAEVTRAYSPQYRDSFKDYEVLSTETVTLESIEAGDQIIDDVMHMETNQGPGYYAMQVKVDAPNDSRDSNNGRAVAIRAD